MADLATLQQWLTEAETARHALLTGKQVARVSAWGKERDYSKSDQADLQSYITELKGKIAALSGCGGRRPIRISF